MKKRILSLALAMVMASSVTVLAATENSISNMKKVYNNTKLEGGSAPELVIEPKASTKSGDAAFKLKLDNAKWLCEEEGSFAEGVEYELLGETAMMVTVDGEKFDLAAEKLVIPLEVEVGDMGIASVIVDSRNSTVSEGTYVFAYSPYPETKITLSTIEDGRYTLKFADEYVGLVSFKEYFELKLPEGFVFEKAADVYGGGKYEGKVEFNIDKENPSKAKIALKTPVNGGKGEMIIENIKIKAIEGAKAGYVMLSVNPLFAKNNEAQFRLFFHSAEELPVVTFGAGERFYTAGGNKIEMDAAVTIDKNNRVIIPARYLANALGVDDESIKWTDADGGKVLIYKDGVTVEAKPGEKYIVVGGKHIELDTSAVIIDERIYLPLRAIANALGVADSNISWDDATKTATIRR